MSFSIHSSAFVDEGEIPRRYTGEGENISPPLSWGALPRGAKESVLICIDSDPRMTKPWIHWLLYKIPIGIHDLNEGMPRRGVIEEPARMLQGRNSWGNIGYEGPLPHFEDEWHTYHFKLLALGTELSVGAALEYDDLIRAINGHICGQVEILGKYQRLMEHPFQAVNL